MSLFDRKNIALSIRISESVRILARNPDKIPIIVECSDEELVKQIKKNKFLVPYDVSASYLLISIRKHMKLDPSEALFMFCDNNLVSGTSIMGTLYENYKTKNRIVNEGDLFLYITITKENTFG